MLMCLPFNKDPGLVWYKCIAAWLTPTTELPMSGSCQWPLSRWNESGKVPIKLGYDMRSVYDYRVVLAESYTKGGNDSTCAKEISSAEKSKWCCSTIHAMQYHVNFIIFFLIKWSLLNTRDYTEIMNSLGILYSSVYLSHQIRHMALELHRGYQREIVVNVKQSVYLWDS